MEALTVGQTFSKLHESLSDYIEAAYHISNPGLIKARKQLLLKDGVIHQIPYFESTPRYVTGRKFSQISDLDTSIIDIFGTRSYKTQKLLINDPPYEHQAEAINQTIIKNKSIIVTTGTGSGKTECFLLPILAKLALEASKKPKISFENNAVRAMILYPMNALVNDQLGRLRLLFGDRNISKKFKEWSGRPVRFARYTGRTLYPGVRDSQRDTERLRSLRDFYVRIEEKLSSKDKQEREKAEQLYEELNSRGKWPSKLSMLSWYGNDGARWQNRNGDFVRCVPGDDDAELLTRHEVQSCPPDILITNYSMLEYMLMRPIERPIFENTKQWLQSNPSEKFLLVIDEAHLYRGAAGTEVALLIRRLRMRLGINPERFQIICTSASFHNQQSALTFAAELSGKPIEHFAQPIKGTLRDFQPAKKGSSEDAQMFASLDLGGFYQSEDENTKAQILSPLFLKLGGAFTGSCACSLWSVLNKYGALNLLINNSMRKAIPLKQLPEMLFESCPQLVGEKAVTALIALGSIAREKPDAPNLLPCRVHAFFRGLPGLWACADPECSKLEPSLRNGCVGKLYHQPRSICECGARVFELFTCRNCGTAYLRAYTDDVHDPKFVWSEKGSDLYLGTEAFQKLYPIDILTQEPEEDGTSELIELDLITGRINPEQPSTRTRTAYITMNRHTDDGLGNGEFIPCGVCGGTSYGNTYVQDMQTKGDQPFEALINTQLQVQPPTATKDTKFAPLRGRKVLIFSDSRQGAARLAPRLQDYSMKDALRPLIVYGFDRLTKVDTLKQFLSLEDIYLAILISANLLEVRLRPALKACETFEAYDRVKKAVENGVMDNPMQLLSLMLTVRTQRIPENLLKLVFGCMCEKFYGFNDLALATFCERFENTDAIQHLPDLQHIAVTGNQKLALVRMWLNEWARNCLFKINSVPDGWISTEIKPHSGNFAKINRFLGNPLSTEFKKRWLPELLRLFTIRTSEAHQFLLNGSELSLYIFGGWTYCSRCRSINRPIDSSLICPDCNKSEVTRLDPDTNVIYKARKGYYRNSTLNALKQPPVNPISFIAAEHTAQLNTAQDNEIFSDAEGHELLFQDVNLGEMINDYATTAIDVLSCTTTMEVGIDIGKLSGVALRNMPPARANYQQRSGRAGRRGNAVATVIAFGGVDTHDAQYFTNPDAMICGAVVDPILSLDNYDIALRHVLAFLLQRYHQTKLPQIRPEDQPQLFEVLGTVESFLDDKSMLNIYDFESYLSTQANILGSELNQWLPDQLNKKDRDRIVTKFADCVLPPLKQCFGK